MMVVQEPLHIEDYRDLVVMPDEVFPVAKEFFLGFCWRGEDLGVALRCEDVTLGVLAEFPWWDDVASELRQWSSARIPTGTPEAPFSDYEESWRCIIWQNGDYIYIVQGDEDSLSRYSRVPATAYFSAWRSVLSLAAVFPGEA